MSDTLIAPLLAVLVILSGGSALVLATDAHDDLAGSTNAAATNQTEPDLVLAFADDYAPGESLLVVDRLNQGTTNAVLDRATGDGPTVGDPTDYRGYVVQLRPAENVTGEFTFVFVREATLQTDAVYQFDADATFFSTEATLLQVGIRRADDQETPETETPTPEDGTPTPGDDTPTPEEGTPTPEADTPTPESNGGIEGDQATDEAITTGEATTASDAEGEDGLLAGLVEFVAGLFGGGDGDDGQQTTVEPGSAS